MRAASCRRDEAMKRRPVLLACALALATVGIVAVGGGSRRAGPIDIGRPAIHGPGRSVASGAAARASAARPGWLPGWMWTAAAALLLLAPAGRDDGRSRWWARPGYQRGPPRLQFA